MSIAEINPRNVRGGIAGGNFLPLDFSGIRHRPETSEDIVDWSWTFSEPGAHRSRALLFDDPNAVVEIPNLVRDTGVGTPSDVSLANTSFSISVWAKRLSTTSNEDWIISQGQNAPNSRLHFGFRNNSVFAFAFYFNNLSISATQHQAFDDQWHYWVGVYDFDGVAGTKTVYVDSRFVAE